MKSVVPSVATAPLNPHAQVRTVTARPVPLDVVALAVRGEVDLPAISFLQNALLAHSAGPDG
jgi:hypothetical protein